MQKKDQFSVKAEMSTGLTSRFAATFMAEAWAQAGVEYDMTWKKWFWFVYYPCFEFNPYADAAASIQGVVYTDNNGFIFNPHIDSARITATLSPSVSIGLSAEILGGLGSVGINGKAGIKGETLFDYKKGSNLAGELKLSTNGSVTWNYAIGGNNTTIGKTLSALGFKVDWPKGPSNNKICNFDHQLCKIKLF